MSRTALREPGVEERERRTIIVERSAGSFGFTLQSYGIHYRDENDVEVITYVDYVDPLGQAHRAGLRSGDVILSINGQDVERADHSTLVSIIQTCPNRIRMVVLFENCVRKVELHMKYIRLQQILEQKAREYQEVCAREKSLVSRMNRGRSGTGTYQTMQLSSQNKDNANSLSCVGSSKSMPRSCSHSSGSRYDASLGREGRGFEGSVKERCLKKTNSYLCINRNGGADCEGCFHQLEDAAKKGVKFKSKSGEAHRSNAQRPRSFHISSCYKDPAYRHQLENDHYLKSQPDWTAVKTYGGHGEFDYESNLVSTHNPSSYNSFPRHHAGDAIGRVNDHLAAPSLIDPSYYRRSLLPKSADDLLAAQFQNQCQVSPSQQNIIQVRRPSTQGGGRGMVQQQSLDSISFYTRPPQPKPVTGMDYSTSRPVHFQPPQHQLRVSLKQVQQRQQQQQQQQLAGRLSSNTLRGHLPPEPSIYDEGGFDEVRSFRTLPLVNRRATEHH